MNQIKKNKGVKAHAANYELYKKFYFFSRTSQLSSFRFLFSEESENFLKSLTSLHF